MGWYTEDAMDRLVGKHIAGLWINNTQDRLVFVCDDGERLAFTAEGDCCSQSWINDLIGVDAVLGHVVVKAEAVDLDDIANPMAEKDERNHDDSVQVYKWTLTTERGQCDIIFRNASNGYYGGWLDATENVSIDGFQQVAADWTA